MVKYHSLSSQNNQPGKTSEGSSRWETEMLPVTASWFGQTALDSLCSGLLPTSQVYLPCWSSFQCWRMTSAPVFPSTPLGAQFRSDMQSHPAFKKVHTHTSANRQVLTLMSDIQGRWRHTSTSYTLVRITLFLSPKVFKEDLYFQIINIYGASTTHRPC